MRLIDADALKELFREVIGRIAIKPEMNGNLEHIIRASAMVIQMIDDAPTVNALNCSEIPNNSDTISRQVAIDALRKMQTYKLFAGDDMILVDKAQVQTELMMLPPAEPEIIRCKDCIYQTESWIGIKYCEAHGDHIGKDYDYCSNARRKENGH